jgi:membrane fusion protein (multidrug efflux system)
MTLSRYLLFVCCLSAAPLMAQPTDIEGSGTDDRRIRTQLVSPDAVILSSELAAKIDALPLREGDAFKRGDKLVVFDCSLYNAQFKKAQAIADSANKLWAVNKRLADLNSVGELELEQSAAKVREAEAELHYMKTSVDKCVIRAPFAGRIAKRLVATHQYVNTGTPLLDILSSEQLELQMIVPSNWLTWLKTGMTFSVQVEELGQQYPAQITRLGARIDPVSQTIAITGKVSASAPELLAGMSGWAQFEPH